MTADNVIYVQEQCAGQWAMWIQPSSEPTRKPVGSDYWHDTLNQAADCSWNLMKQHRGEYGTVLLPKAEPPWTRERALDNYRYILRTDGADLRQKLSEFADEVLEHEVSELGFDLTNLRIAKSIAKSIAAAKEDDGPS